MVKNIVLAIDGALLLGVIALAVNYIYCYL